MMRENNQIMKHIIFPPNYKQVLGSEKEEWSFLGALTVPVSPAATETHWWSTGWVLLMSKRRRGSLSWWKITNH